MKQNTVKVKERYNWPVTILLIIGIVLVILLPLYMALMIAIKDPTDMNNILALPRKMPSQETVKRANSCPSCIITLSVPCLYRSR